MSRAARGLLGAGSCLIVGLMGAHEEGTASLEPAP